jgi:hypothetical protein
MSKDGYWLGLAKGENGGYSQIIIPEMETGRFEFFAYAQKDVGTGGNYGHIFTFYDQNGKETGLISNGWNTNSKATTSHSWFGGNIYKMDIKDPVGIVRIIEGGFQPSTLLDRLNELSAFSSWQAYDEKTKSLAELEAVERSEIELLREENQKLNEIIMDFWHKINEIIPKTE